MSKQITPRCGIVGFIRRLLYLISAGTLPRYTFRVLDDADHAVIYEIAAGLVSRDRRCKVKWFHANGCDFKFKATIVPLPKACPPSEKPARQVNLGQPSAETAIEEVRAKMKECMDETEGKEP